VRKRSYDEREVTVAEENFPADWVDEEDYVLLKLCASLYEYPIKELDGFVLLERGTDSVRAWVRDDEAIVGIMGTSPKTGLSNILDDAALAGITGGRCSLAVVNQAKAMIDSLGDKKIKVGGHSLGGAAAFCVAHQYPDLERVVAFNGGAPPTGGAVKGTGMKCRFYHIVGDIISTHVDDSTAHVTRIHLDGQTDWSDTAFYHSTKRFFEERAYTKWTAQQEQDDMVHYVYNLSPTTQFLTLLTGLISKELNRDRIREIICKNPIPTTQPNCPDIYNTGRDVATTAGAIVGGVLGGPIGAALGGTALNVITSGYGLLDIFAPEFLPGIKKGIKTGLQVGQFFNRNKRVRMR
jgi:hypothetical protein